jgi:hypothetical protein
MDKPYIESDTFINDIMLMKVPIHRHGLERQLNTAKEMYQVLFDEKGEGQHKGCSVFYDCNNCPLNHTYCDKRRIDKIF